MKRHKPLQRTPLKRSGQPLANRSQTNSRPAENLSLRQQYRRQQNGECEIEQQLGRVIVPVAWPYTLELHHIFRRGGRHDLWGNMLVISKTAHDWIHAHPPHGEIIALYAKWKKGEWNQAELDQAAGKNVKEFVAAYSPATEGPLAWIGAYWLDLCRGIGAGV